MVLSASGRLTLLISDIFTPGIGRRFPRLPKRRIKAEIGFSMPHFPLLARKESPFVSAIWMKTGFFP